MPNQLMNRWFSIGKLQKIGSYLGPKVRTYLFFGFLTGLLLFVTELSLGYGFQSFLMGIGIMGSTSSKIPSWIPSSNLFMILMFVFALAALRGICQWLQFYMGQAAAEVLRFEQRSRILQWAFYSDSVSSSEALTLFTQRSDASASAVLNLQSLSVLVPNALLLWGALFYLAPRLTLGATLFLGILGYLLRTFDRKISEVGKDVHAEIDQVNKRVLLNIKNLLLMQIYGTQRQEELRVSKNLAGYKNHILTFLKLSGAKYAAPQILGVALICTMTLFAHRQQILPPSALLAYFYMFVRFVQNFSEGIRTLAILSFYMPQFSQMGEWQADFKKQAETTIQRGDLVAPIRQPIGWKLQYVAFSYPGSTSSVIQNLNLTIGPGTCLVVTGESGAGKSTFLGLLLGNLTPTKGSIRTFSENESDRSLNEIRPALLRGIGYVGPESFLIEGTVLESLSYGLSDPPSQTEVRDALLKAECQFIFDMPNGIEHHLTEQGQGLSAGQKQRLSLARALLRKPKVLILDEATANLDASTEDRLVETLRGLKGQFTLVAVTHRQALLSIADHHIKL